jgi:hypothetical protein
VVDESNQRQRVERLARWAIWLVGAAALLYLIAEHRPHLFGWLPYLILLGCPVMHFFMHRGHQHRHSPSHQAKKDGAEYRG